MVSLEIGDAKIRAVCGKKEQDAVLVSAYFEAEATADALRDAFAACAQPDRRAVVSLCGTDLFTHRLTLPKARPGQIFEMISHAICDFPAARDCYIDYMIERKLPSDAGKKMLDILVCGVPKQLADAHYDIITKAGLTAHCMDLRQNCVHRLLAEHSELNGQSLHGKAVLLLEAGDSLISCDLIVDGASVFERSIPLGRLAGFLGSAPDVHDFDLIGSAGGISDANPLYTRISDEAQRMVQFSLTRAAKLPVSQLFLYGANGCDDQLASYLGDMLGIPASPILDSPGIKFTPEYTGPEQGDVFGYAAALF